MILFLAIPEIMTLLSKYKLENNIILASCSTFVTQYTRINYPAIQTGLVINYQQSVSNKLSIDGEVNYVIIDHRNLLQDDNYLESITEKNIKIGIYGIDSGNGITSNELPAIVSDHSQIELIITHDITKSMTKL